MVENRERRDRLRDTAIEVLAADGARGLTHRAVDRVAGLPQGTTKNYFGTRDALLETTAERCVERYWMELRTAQDEVVRDRATLLDLLTRLVDRAVTHNRSRLVAYLELHAEGSRRPAIQEVLARLTEADLDAHLDAQRQAGLPATRRSAAMVVLGVNTALTYLVTQPRSTLEAYGLDDPGTYLRDLLTAVYPSSEASE
ncbi:TetR/AcrR family transcriptional regulator [Spiractinospora alimapuensis]|uniref:TetR/AcrR family transcriptional regulator n=1 Tax=Spiractinospora alimapuensis TaxID=2820884 RepID=UPI001F2B1661|nr:TetR/AcrR family transcriptional regulator [Spiractinospora alimapuensis]QVQ50651.1 TetR/AcrR family transcriptional regulator [Spiractinospora alimapuensis]